MNSKLFLGIILLFVIISNMTFTIIEGVCNYDDETSIGRKDASAADDGNAAPGVAGSSGSPVKGRSEEECLEATNVENQMKLKDVQKKLNELKNIVANVKNGVYGNTKQIKKNKLANSQMKSAVGDGDMDEEDKKAAAKQDAAICDKYPVSCS